MVRFYIFYVGVICQTLVLLSLIFLYQFVYGRIQNSLPCAIRSFIEIDLAVHYSFVGFVLDGECALGVANDYWLSLIYKRLENAELLLIWGIF